MALASRATAPLAAHLGPWVGSLIDKQYAAAVVYVKARHARRLAIEMRARRLLLMHARRDRQLPGSAGNWNSRP
ncbi:MAG: hypothetical protein H7Z19_17275 [Chitinophagaceae bacterium]|nr:hypothetical protein [Rubrivivax sp.]